MYLRRHKVVVTRFLMRTRFLDRDTTEESVRILERVLEGI
jgi:hypothetical protein